jgi:histidine triad (HIT) family protein
LSAERDRAADCAFCAVAQGRDPDARIVASAPKWVAFFPPEPATLGHTLIIPREHVRDLWAADETTVAAIAWAVVDVGTAVRRALQPDGMNLITSAGAAAEQTVFHLHLHVVPRWDDDGFGRIWPAKGRMAQADVDDAVDRVRRACKS